MLPLRSYSFPSRAEILGRLNSQNRGYLQSALISYIAEAFEYQNLTYMEIAETLSKAIGIWKKRQPGAVGLDIHMKFVYWIDDLISDDEEIRILVKKEWKENYA